jgi:biotin carboxylase
MNTRPTILFFSPGYPPEMAYFVRGLAQVGARVLGVGDSPPGGLPPLARDSLDDYLQVNSLWREEALVEAVRRWPVSGRLDGVECLWEPGMLVAARLREAFGLPGLTVAETVPFRDKEVMKSVLDRAGIRTPRHFRARTEGEIRAAAERLGYPLIVKPIAGAGSADTHRVDGPSDLERVIRLVAHVAEVSVEEFIEGEEYTFDTICGDGQILYFNMSWYRPPPLIARSQEWVSPQTMVLRDVDAPHLAAGREMGRAVLRALGLRTGFTHMEWFRKADGEAVFGEIAARPPGARTTEIMNYACDFDSWTAWAEAVTRKRISQPIERRYNCVMVCKRARGQGRITRIEGLDAIRRSFGRHVVSIDLLPVGAPRRNWKQTLLSDGWIILRHPDLRETMRMADAVGSVVTIHAG